MALFDGKTALVTGRASGMRRLARWLYAQNGAKVVISDVAEEHGEETAQEIRADGGEATLFVLTYLGQKTARAWSLLQLDRSAIWILPSKTRGLAESRTRLPTTVWRHGTGDRDQPFQGVLLHEVPDPGDAYYRQPSKVRGYVN